MNIFRLDNDPIIAAEFACDKHVIKMILESSQLLSTAARVCGSSDTMLYKSTHINHPSNIWARESKGNYVWLCFHLEGLLNEYTRRYGKHHKCESLLELLKSNVSLIPQGKQTAFRLAMPEEYKTKDPVHSYRLYYAGSKFRFCKWKTTQPPWWEEYRNIVKSQGLEAINQKDDGVK